MEESAELEDLFAASLPMTETVQNMKINKKATVKFLIVLSFPTILQSNIDAIYFEKTKCQGKNEILLNKAGSVIFIHDQAISRDFCFFFNPELIFFNSALYFNGK